jgi:hypothetical protein
LSIVSKEFMFLSKSAAKIETITEIDKFFMKFVKKGNDDWRCLFYIIITKRAQRTHGDIYRSPVRRIGREQRSLFPDGFYARL